jgi:tetratricopeptide (TPR) repeat protein
LELGENQKALESYNQALTLYKAEKKPLVKLLCWAASVISTFSQARLKRHSTSTIKHWRFSVPRRIPPHKLKHSALSADLQAQLGESQQALATYNQALELQRERKDLLGQAEILEGIGLLYFTLGQFQLALDSYNQALKLWQAAQGNLSGTDLAFNLTQQAGILRGIGSPIPQGDLAILQKRWTFITKRERFTKRREIDTGKRPFSTTSAIPTTNWGKWRKPSMP